MEFFRRRWGNHWEFYVNEGPVSFSVWFGRWVMYPVFISSFALPASFTKTIIEMLPRLPQAAISPLAMIIALAFWPVYVTFLVLAWKTRKRRYLVVLGGMMLFASIQWHDLCMGWLGI